MDQIWIYKSGINFEGQGKAQKYFKLGITARVKTELENWSGGQEGMN